jgi:hypothetical protein
VKTLRRSHVISDNYSVSGVKIQETFKDWRPRLGRFFVIALAQFYVIVSKPTGREESRLVSQELAVFQLDRLQQSGNLYPLCLHCGASPETTADTKRKQGSKLVPLGKVSKGGLEVFRLGNASTTQWPKLQVT